MNYTSHPYTRRWTAALATALLCTAGPSWAQPAAPNPDASDTTETEEQAVVLSPFEVSTEGNTGYTAATTLAGNRLNTELRDIGNAVTVVTQQFLKDIGAKDNQTLLQYTVGTEVGNYYGNFSGGNASGTFVDESSRFTNPNTNTRVRGLAAADNSREYFVTDIPWDGYNVDGVDLQRGANSIMFGQGSPAGVINIRTKQASFKDRNEFNATVGSWGTKRSTLDINKVLIKDQLAIRLAAVYNDQEYKQDPAYEIGKRIYAATRFEPALLKRNGARTSIRASVEAGNVSSNHPRSIAPLDHITPWFNTASYDAYNIAGQAQTFPGLNKSTFNPITVQTSGFPGWGQAIKTLGSGAPNPDYQPWLGNFGQQFGGVLNYFDSTSPTAMASWTAEPKSTFGIGTDGNIDKGTGVPYQRPVGVAGYGAWALNAYLPMSEFGVYLDKSITDPSIYDFYNQLIDGPNKKEWQKFHTYNFTIDQTFFDDQIGLQYTYNSEQWKGGQVSLLTGDRQSLNIDINSVYSNGTNDAGQTGLPFSDGTPNPNVGRPFVSDSGQFGNNETQSDKYTSRLTGFLRHDFTHDKFGPDWLRRTIGSHTVTGLYSREGETRDSRSWQRYGILDPAYEAYMNSTGIPFLFTQNELASNAFIYLGPSLADRSSASGAHIPNPSVAQTITSGQVHIFDSHWNKPTDPADPNYVNPAAQWENWYYPVGNASHLSTQSENPANYVGWTTVPVSVTDSEAAPGNRDKLTTTAQLSRRELTSQAFVWQGHVLDNSIVGTYGVRKDIDRRWSVQQVAANFPSTGGVMSLTPDNYYDMIYGEANMLNRIQVTSHAWTVAAHLNELPFISKWARDLPIQVSLFYNISTNFQPAGQRVDIYGDPLPAPEGKTIDRAILLETRDGKYSLKLTKYETSSKNGSSSAINAAWFIGSSQAWAANWVNRFQYDWSGDTQGTAMPHNGPPGSEWMAASWNYDPAPKADGSLETREEADARENSVVQAWRNWQASVNPKFYQAWGINLNDHDHPVSATAPAGLSVTEDAVSKGYELEFNATPIRNWRLTLNASKQEAVRSNIGGTALNEFVNAYQTALDGGKPGSVGDLRIWWGSAGADTALKQWNGTFAAEWNARKLQEGSAVPELRRWHYNVISNYDFDRGMLKGFNVGAAMRYQSEIILGYQPVYTPKTATDPSMLTYDLNSPYYGPSETDWDFWVGYRRKLWKNVEWNIQLNLRNAFVGNALVPLNTEPDGTPAMYRIRPPRTWELSNTFTF